MIDILENGTRKRLGVIDNIISASAERGVNTIWTASFSLPAEDPKNELLDGHRIAHIKNCVRDFGLYRIIRRTLVSNEAEDTYTYECEHVLAMLLNDQLEGYNQIGNLGIFTPDVIRFALSKQRTQNWVLGDCDFLRQFEYSWQSETILAAIWSIANPIASPYLWTWDTTAYPWTLNLKSFDPDGKPECYAWRGWNLMELTETTDWENIATRLECLGYGEGMNQLNIASLNGGDRFLRADQDAVDKYGIITRTWTDRRYEDQFSLKESGQSILDALSKPRQDIGMRMINRYAESHNPHDLPEPGKRIRINHDLLDFDHYTSITKVITPEIFGAHEQETVEVSTDPVDIAQSVADAQNKARIESTYAQGATNIYAQSFSDNASQDRPAKMKLWVPEDTVRINKIVVAFELEQFRAYSLTSAASGGDTVTSSTQPTQTSSTQPSQTSSAGGGVNTTTSYVTQPTQSSGPSSRSTSDHNSILEEAAQTGETNVPTSNNGRHWHYYWRVLQSHSHGMDHNHTVYGYSHDHSVTQSAHTHDTPAHNHTIPGHNHTVPFPVHSHGIVYGIYEGPRATSATLLVDGRAVPFSEGKEIDIASYLSVGAGGEVERGKYHTLEIKPNGLSRITATATTILFIQSRISA